MRAKALGDGEDKVGRRGSRWQLAGELEADDLWEWREERLAEQYRFGFDAADTEPEHAKARDHCGVRIGADTGVGEGEWCTVNLLNADHGGEALKVYLVDDPSARWHHAEAIEGPLRPTKELIALCVALIFARYVLLKRLWGCPSVDLHGVINDEIGGNLWVDALRIDAELARSIAQRGKINDRWDACEILQHDASRREGEFALISRRYG